MSRRIGLIGVPSIACAHWPGHEKASRVMREAGLVERFRAAGMTVIDHGDMPCSRWCTRTGSTGVRTTSRRWWRSPAAWPTWSRPPCRTARPRW